MKIIKKLILGLFLLLLLSSLFFKYRENIQPNSEKITSRQILSNLLWKLDPHHEIRTTLFGDPQKNTLQHILINREESVQLSTTEKDTEYFREKWKFRATSTSQNNGRAPVDDIDNDGTPDVFIGSGSSKVYRLNGKTGEIVWEYVLPFGITSTLAYFLADLDNDGMKEFIFGNSISHLIRVSALRTGKNIKDRVLWTRNVSGDFFQGGLSYFRNTKGEIRIVAGTRDAPYSRGSVNILDRGGNRVVPEITGFDVCNNHPTYLDVNNDGELDVLMGSHGFYGAKYANSLTAINSQTGKIIWSTPVGTDTGWLNFPILDIDDKGKKEIIIPKVSNFLIYSPNGKKQGEIKGAGEFQASFQNSNGDTTLLYTDFKETLQNKRDLKTKLISQNLRTKEVNYELPLVAFNIVSILDFDDDSTPDILATLKIDNIITLLVFNAYTGNLTSAHQLNSKNELKSKFQEHELLGLFHNIIKTNHWKNESIVYLQTLDSLSLLKSLYNLPLPEAFREIIQKVLYERISQGVKSGVLVDLDGDKYWELLGMENRYTEITEGRSDPKKGYYTAYDTPFPILTGYNPNNTHTAFRANLFKRRNTDPGLQNTVISRTSP
jgi:outer membrane protein assembly factor BamB